MSLSCESDAPHGDLLNLFYPIYEPILELMLQNTRYFVQGRVREFAVHYMLKYVIDPSDRAALIGH
jgi:hypothetical protein